MGRLKSKSNHHLVWIVSQDPLLDVPTSFSILFLSYFLWISKAKIQGTWGGGQRKVGFSSRYDIGSTVGIWTVGGNICSIFLHFLSVFPIFVCVFWYALATAVGLFTFLAAKLIQLDQAFFSSALSGTGIRQEWETCSII